MRSLHILRATARAGLYFATLWLAAGSDASKPESAEFVHDASLYYPAADYPLQCFSLKCTAAAFTTVTAAGI